MISSKNNDMLLRIGFLYALYRISISLILLTLFFLSPLVELRDYNPSLLYIILAFFICSIVQLMCFLSIDGKRLQILFFGIVDIILFVLVSFQLGFIDNQVGILFVISIFIISLTQPKNIAFLSTLLTVLYILTFPFLDFISIDVEYKNPQYISSAVLSLIFIIINILTVTYSKRFNSLIDLTKQRTEDLERYKVISEEVVSAINVGYIVIDQKYKIELINPTAIKIFKYNNEIKTLHDLNALCAEEFKKMSLIFKNNGSFIFKEGDFKYLVCFKPMGKNKLCLLTIENMDVINSRLQHLKLMELGQLSASIAHEIRNPLSVITQANSLLIDSVSDEEKSYCEIIKKQSNRIDRIIDSTLSMVKGGKFNPQNINLNDFFINLINENFSLSKDFISLSLYNYNIMFDCDHFEQIFVNLINNALNHGAKNNEPNIQIKASVLNSGILAIDILDKGDGVKTKDVANLFDPFFTTSINGTGLGLYLCKNLCETNNSNINYIESKTGACFRITTQAWD